HNVSFHLVYPLHSKAASSGNGHQGALALTLVECPTLPRRLRELQPSAINYGHQIAYPVNLLRNVARRNVRSQFVFVVDIDLQVSQGLHDAFLAFAKDNSLFSRADHQEVFVVPAFEAAEHVTPPRNKAELLGLLERGAARPFYAELCHKCHKHTDYEAWTNAPSALDNKLEVLYQVSWKDPWEPFFIAHNSAPLFDERFRQYGFNRISQACEMHIAGYSFAVLNNAFVVHRGLKRSGDFHREKDKDLDRNRLNFRQFKTELKEKYKQSPRRCY
ncbi:N-acetyllactosaminide beta-1, partial [Tropilaelaps mercedesae]